MQSVKCVVVGDSGVGKTYLLSTYIRKSFPKDYIPDFYSTYTTQVDVDGQTVSLTLGDTAGREGYEQLRPLCYGQVDVIIICFSIDSPASCQNARLKWLPEVKNHCPDAPIILVGTKSDLRGRGEQNQTTVTHQQGTAMAKQIKAVKYLECASISQDGLDEVFDEAVRTFFSCSNTTKKPCVLL